MNEYIRYHKYKNFICEIEIINNKNNEINYNATYYTDKCKIKKIINMITGENINKIDDIYYVNSIIYDIRKINLYDTMIDMPNIIYFLSYEKCFYHNFIEENQYLLFNSGFCGTHNMHNKSGEFIKSIMINNNIIINLN